MDAKFSKYFLHEVILESNVVETFLLFEAFEPSLKHAFSKGFSPQGWTTSKHMDAYFCNFWAWLKCFKQVKVFTTFDSSIISWRKYFQNWASIVFDVVQPCGENRSKLYDLESTSLHQKSTKSCT